MGAASCERTGPTFLTFFLTIAVESTPHFTHLLHGQETVYRPEKSTSLPPRPSIPARSIGSGLGGLAACFARGSTGSQCGRWRVGRGLRRSIGNSPTSSDGDINELLIIITNTTIITIITITITNTATTTTTTTGLLGTSGRWIPGKG